MPRNPSGVYSAPPGTTAVSGTTIASAAYNSLKDDLVQDANTARPVVAGGTGAATDVLARENLGVYGRSLLIDTTGTTAEASYDNQVIDFTTSGTLTTEPAADLGDGWRCYVFASGGDVTINPNLDETINGLATLVVPMGASGVLSVYNGNFRFEFYGGERVAFRVHKNNANQDQPSAGAYQVTWSTKQFDVGGFFDTATGRYTPAAGAYDFSVACCFRGSNGGQTVGVFRVELRKNGVTIAKGTAYRPDAASSAVPTINTSDEANGTDYYEVFAMGDTIGTAFIIAGGSADTWFSGHAI